MRSQSASPTRLAIAPMASKTNPIGPQNRRVRSLQATKPKAMALQTLKKLAPEPARGHAGDNVHNGAEWWRLRGL
eukprot:366768-Pelagomonas_calceolata.AAC.2